jgi:hypothetical protein
VWVSADDTCSSAMNAHFWACRSKVLRCSASYGNLPMRLRLVSDAGGARVLGGARDSGGNR